MSAYTAGRVLFLNKLAYIQVYNGSNRAEDINLCTMLKTVIFQSGVYKRNERAKRAHSLYNIAIHILTTMH